MAKESQSPVTQTPSSGQGDFVAVTFRTTSAVQQKNVETARAKVQHLLNINEKDIDINPADVETFKATGLLPNDATADQVKAGIKLYTSAGKGAGQKLLEQTEKAGFLNDTQTKYFTNVAFISEALEETYPREAEVLSIANNEPQINIERQPIPYQAQVNQMSFQNIGDTLRPVTDEIKGRATEFGKEKVKQLGKKAFSALKKGGKELAKKGAETAVKAGVSTAAKTAVSTGLKGAISAALGGITGGVSLLIQAGLMLAGKLLGAIKGLFTTKDADRKLAAVAGVFTLGFLAIGQVIPAAFTGFISIGAASSAAGGLGGISSGIVGVGQSIGYSIAYVVVPSLIAPVGIALLSLTLLTLFIYLVITNSAYMVPPGGFSPSGSAVTNPYIKITKTPSPKGPFDNDEVNNGNNLTIDYTIRIKALTGALEGVSFEYDCKVYSGENISCPTIKNITAGFEGEEPQSFNSIGEAMPGIISPTTDYIINYSVDYPRGRYNDSLISDTLSVTATIGTTQTTATGSASIIIGDPEVGCFELVGTWPSNYEQNIMAAITNLSTGFPAYTAKVCAAGAVKIGYETAFGNYWGWHRHTESVDIIIYAAGLRNTADATYILAHEAGHHLASINGDIYSRYEDYPGTLSELPFCTYSATVSPSEGFAEAIALYTSLPRMWCGGTYEERYPFSYGFADEVIFR